MAAPMAATADTAAPPPPPPAAEPAVEVSLAPSDMPPPPAAAAAAAPPPPAPAPPTAAPDTAAPPPPPPAAEPAVHMAAPTAPADTAARPPPPPPPAPELAAKVAYPPPHFPSPHPDAPAPKKRRLEESGFHASPYYKIRAAVADLRFRFIQVHEATDFRKSDAAREILREIKTVMELSKKMRLDLSASSEPMKPLEKPLAGAVKDGPTEPIPSGAIPSGERNQVPQTGQTAIPPNNANDGVPATQA